MLTEICKEIKNYFCRQGDKHFGKFKISGGTLEPSDFLKDGQYFRIIGSVFNDGVHQFPAVDLTDEDFDGAVWAMSVPPRFIALAEDIKTYENSEGAKPTAFASESFGGYSYSKATGKNGAVLSWQEQFSKRLSEWRKI